MKENLLVINFVAVVLIILYTLTTNEEIDSYVKSLKTTDSVVTSKEHSELQAEIIKKSKDYEIPAQDAVIDRVWKGIPAYNGLKVNIDKSLKAMKKEKKFDPKKLVLEEVSAKVSLSDLPAAPIYKGHPDKEMVSFIINVAWGNDYIPSILSILKEHQVKATFSLEGRWVKENPNLAKMIAEEGHEIGNHSYTHADFKQISPEKMSEEILKTNDVITATTGEVVSLFGPPSGSFRDETVEVAARHNLQTILWTIDTIDWQNPSTDVLKSRVMTKLHNGAMILMHPTKPTETALDDLITAIKNKGYLISTVSDLLSEKRVKRPEK